MDVKTIPWSSWSKVLAGSTYNIDRYQLRDFARSKKFYKRYNKVLSECGYIDYITTKHRKCCYMNCEGGKQHTLYEIKEKKFKKDFATILHNMGISKCDRAKTRKVIYCCSKHLPIQNKPPSSRNIPMSMWSSTPIKRRAKTPLSSSTLKSRKLHKAKSRLKYALNAPVEKILNMEKQIADLQKQLAEKEEEISRYRKWESTIAPTKLEKIPDVQWLQNNTPFSNFESFEAFYATIKEDIPRIISWRNFKRKYKTAEKEFHNNKSLEDENDLDEDLRVIAVNESNAAIIQEEIDSGELNKKDVDASKKAAKMMKKSVQLIRRPQKGERVYARSGSQQGKYGTVMRDSSTRKIFVQWEHETSSASYNICQIEKISKDLDTKHFIETTIESKAKPYLGCSPKKLSIFSEFLMTLMHLRLNLSPAVLANYYLKNSTDTAKQLVLNILRTWISFLYTVLTEDDDLWLNPEYAMRLSSSTFENQFGINTVAVGDCSNMNCSATPGNSFSNNVTYSMYYQSNCGKYLLAISRVGGILFISDLMCGRTSDLDLHEYCNFFDPKFWKLNDAEMPMPVYMYDKGLGRTAKKEGLRVGFELKTSGIVSNDASKSKSFIRRQEAYEISKMRIRVECVIGFLKKNFLC